MKKGATAQVSEINSSLKCRFSIVFSSLAMISPKLYFFIYALYALALDL
ncbi:MAG: hypothetical protein PHI24_01245 [Desulfitobacteriaceae bacterium]|nr:hypothetical protein [Desulfitobacteriaceae bacterium]